jgi:hypothetical protein
MSDILYAPVDTESIKKKLANLTANSKNKSKYIWKPVVGEQGTIVRIVPYRHAKDPFTELFFHYEVANQSLLCAGTFGKQCPICEFTDELRKVKSEEAIAHFKKIMAKKKVFVPIIVRGKEEEGIKFWGLNRTVYEKLLTYYIDPEYGDLAHPVEGTDILVKFSGPDDKIKFGKTDIFLKRNKSKLFEDKSKVAALIKSVPNVNEIFPEQSYDELKKVLDMHLRPESEDSKKTSEEFISSIPAEEVGNDMPGTNLDADFDDMFKDNK